MQAYQSSMPQAMLTTQPQGVMMTQQPSHVVSTCAIPQVGQPRYAIMTRNGQPLAAPPMMMQPQRPMMIQQPVMMMQNRPLIVHPRQMPMAPQQYAIPSQSMPVVPQQQYSMEPTTQQEGQEQSSLPAPASVVSEPIKPTAQCRTSILSQSQSLAGVRTMADMQPQSQNPPARKSVTINLKPEINSVPVNSTTSRLPPELNPGPPTVETEPANQNKFLSINSNLSQGISFNQIDLNGQMNQYNNSGQGSIQTSQIPGNVQAALSGFYPSHDVPPVEPPIPEHFNSTQPSTQFLRNSNHFCNQPTPQMSQQPLSVDAQPYMLPKALQELSDEKVVEQLAEMEATSETMLDTSLAGTEPAGDSQTQKPLDSSNHIKMLKTKQTVMECVMRKLLRSMKQIQDLDPERRNKTEVEAEHRLKMARMMQLLMLQRKNLQQQVDALTQSHSSLLQKHQCLKTYSEGCVSENLELNKKCRKLQTERDSKEAQIKALMQLSCKLQKKLEGHAHTELALENTTLEVKRLVCDNENLKAANQQLETSYNENVKEREGLTLQNNQLKMDLDRIRTELANQRVRTEKVSAENSSLRNQLSIAEAGSKTAAKKSVEYGQLKEAYENLQFDHQRLQMLYISETETRRELHNQLQEVNGNIRVISRFRPSEECDEDVESPFEFCAMDKIFVCGKSIPISVAYQRQLGYNQPQAYTARDEFFAFNRVFQENANQADIFEEIQPIVGSFVDGYNVCILAYGPTGSGKTYTMQGTKNCPGICRRAVTEVFALCDPLQGIWCTEINIAMFEIHNEVIYDLLAPQITPVKLCDNGSDVRLVNAEEKITTSEQETMHWIEKGYVRRKVSSTRLNSESSRSHLIIRMHLTLVSTLDNQRRTSSLVLCDLAGSESAERIEADETLHMETGYINRSLVTLARVFETLRRKSGQCASTGLAIPYRDSKLTHLLKPCLGGQAKCVLIVTASPEQKHLDRTLKALEFAQRAMQVSLGRPAKNSRILVSNLTPRS
uniref:Kinesin family member c3 n=1 Tax=Echinococcus granulosus TaxID=6210 RepID=A0A068X3A0_ECHGR|nr:kinesin family member c3 [Echinococcus granulosus]